MKTQTILTGVIVDEDAEFTLIELSEACGRTSEWIIELVEEGVIEPVGADQEDWRFRGTCLRRVQIAQRLESDLGVNLPGAALALELLDELGRLRRNQES